MSEPMEVSRHDFWLEFPMDGLLSQKCKGQFLAGDRRRGEGVWRSDRITLTTVDEAGVEAVALGSLGESYAISLDFLGLRAQELGVYCECPRFSDGEHCKHLWATIREVESRYTLKLPPLDQLYLYERMPDLDADRSNGRRPAKAKPLPRATKSKKGMPAWKSDLMQALQESGRREVATGQPIPGALQELRYWFAICLEDLVDEDRFRIHVYQSKPKVGGWSVPAKVRISKSDLANVQDDLQRRVLSLLDWDPEAADLLYYHYRNEHHTYLSLSSHLLPETLSALCATGRFVWSMEQSKSLKDYRVIQFPDPTEWGFFLKLSPTAKAKTLQVQPVLKRRHGTADEDVRPVETVVGVCDSGAVLLEDRVIIVRPEDTHWVRGWQRSGGFELQHSDLQEFLQTLFGWPQIPELDIDDRLGIGQSQGQPAGKLKLSSAVEGDANKLKAEILFKYGEHELPAEAEQKVVWEADSNSVWSRDAEAENRLLEQLQQFSFHQVHYRYGEYELRIHRKWFGDVVRTLSERGWEVVADGKRQRLASDFNIQVTSGEDWFDLGAEVDFDGQQVALPTLLKAVQRGANQVVLDDGSCGILPEAWLEQISDWAKIGDVEGDAVRFRRNQALVLDMLLDQQQQVTLDRSFTAWCQRLKNFSGIKPAKEPRGFQGELRAYQQNGLGWFRFLRDFDFGGCLADDMGLGKTVQVLALLQSRRSGTRKKGEARKPSIAVVPKSLVFNWLDEAVKFAPKLKLVDYTGITRADRLQDIPDCDLVVTTYATCRRDIEKLVNFHFDYAILDEAQAVKNPRAQASKAVRVLNADHRLAMTGTPIENHVGDLWSLMDFLNPGMLGPTNASSFTASAVADGDPRIGQLSTALRPFILRRTKDQVLKELPEKTEQTLYCDMLPKQKKLYRELRDHYRASLTSKVKQIGLQKAKIHVLEALMRLRQTACDPRLVDPKQSVQGAKLELLVDQLEDVLSEGHKALVFSQFTSLLKLVRQEFDKRQWSYEYLDGHSRRRDACVKRFQEDGDCSVFLISLKAGGHGLNLTAADYVYILDPWWNPAVEAQAIDRAHRMGQQKPVMAYRMIARGTVEEKIVQLQQSKRDLADAIITADQSLIRRLSMEDLQVLFE